MVSDLIAVPILVATLGFVGVYTGWKRWRVHSHIADVTPTPVRELSSPGVVELEGEMSPVAEPLTAPVTGRDAAAAAWTVEEWDERGDTSTWREVARGIELPAVEVTDPTGSIEVEPVSKRETAGNWTQTTGVSAADGVRIDDVLAEFETFPVELELGPEEERPARIRRLHDDHGLSEEPGSITNVVDVGKKHGRRRYSEQVVAPDEAGYVLGHVEARDEPTRERIHPDEAVVTTPDDGLFVVSDQDEASLAAEFGSSARTLVFGGAAAVVLGVAGLAYMVLPL